MSSDVSRSAPPPDVAPYDALLLVGFGGPEGPDDVVPFLENVTRGRGIPRERLVEVGAHYQLFGGRSPINDQNRALLAAIREDLAAAGIDLPVYWGNRNWDPYLDDVVTQMARDGHRRVAAFVTSAYSSYSSCRQYRENLAHAAQAARDAGLEAPVLDRFRVYFNHPGFAGPNVEAVLTALEELPAEHRDAARLVFVTHSIPTTMNDGSGPDGDAYRRQHLDLAAHVAAEVAAARGVEHAWDLVYCSRSGPPQMPWLEPDVNDHLEELAGAGVPAVVMAPIGFVSDHMEVIYDLDTEALATAADLGLAAARAATAGVHHDFVALARELLVERAAAERGEQPERPAVGSFGACWDRCAVDCCPNPRAALPVAGSRKEVDA
ncbi:ferrochelatase [Nocardioides zeae]|uniref:Coproporphyrin III ferrochelatase n=1 Tax=Nocardioides imazamoxiresistens TaxID=3231893 RepID=A0ABU3PZJ1_9ACTN|nr:ferrochelatase [Nocardioides zeae]MDT9594601.1 ferrochelatase [Nocardioides zeae]